MKQTDLEKRLTQSLHNIPQGEEGLEQTILLARAQVRRRYKRERIPFHWFLRKQVRYIGWQLWAVQGLTLLGFDRMLIWLYSERFWDSATAVARLLLCVSALVAMMALPLLYRSRRYRMQEIESASYFSSVKLLTAKLAVIGVGDAALLAGMFLTSLLRTSMQAGSLAFCLLLPFLVMSAACLYMMGHCSGTVFFVGSLTLGTAMILLTIILPGRWLVLLQQNMTMGWSILWVSLLAFSAKQLRYLFCRSSYAELQL